MKLLDRSVAIDYLRGRPEAVELLTELVATDEVVASELLRFELFAGAREEDLDELESFCSALEWVPVSTATARVASFLARQHRASHTGVGDVDYLIAASAIVADAELMTTDIGRYPMIDGLEPAY